MIDILEADSILLDFGGRRVLSDVYLKCETGKISGLLGRNGQGKSCLMKIIYGALPAESKSVRINHQTIYHPFKRPDLLVYLPQFNFIPGSLTPKRVFQDFMLDFAEFEKIFPEISGWYKTSLANLSGGTRRLIELYSILKANARFSMLDEPFTYLSPLHIEKVKDLLTEEKKNKGFLITDHMFRHITDISDHVYLLKDGKTHLTKNINDIEALGYARI